MTSPAPTIAEKLARLCWPDAEVIVTPGKSPSVHVYFGDKKPYLLLSFKPDHDANDWERVLGVLAERTLIYKFAVRLDGRPGHYPDCFLILTAPLPDRCAAALAVLEAHAQEQEKNNDR